MAKESKHSLTLDEHDALLKEEGRYEAVKELQRQQEEERQKKAADWSNAEKPLVEELNRVGGVAIQSVGELVNTRESYPDAVPVLLEHIARPYPERVREGIARALVVPEAKGGWNTLLKAFLHETDKTSVGPKWALALALGAAGSDEVLDDVILLLRDKSLGENRAPLLAILGRSRDPRIDGVLDELRDDVSIGQDVKKLLRKRELRNQEPHPLSIS